MQNSVTTGVVLGLDVGDARIGVARAHSFARLPEPLEVIERSKQDALERIKDLAARYDATLLIIGLPSYKSGQEGPQAAAIRAFAESVHVATSLPVIFVDESFTSVEADSYKKSKLWQNQTTNDALAACLILERYFAEGAINV